METLAVPKIERLQKIISTLTECLSEMDEIGAHVAAAHLDSALIALQSQFDLHPNISNSEYHHKDAS